MSGTPNRASGPTGKPRRKSVSFTLATARAMLPLVRRIVADAVSAKEEIDRSAPELDQLQRHRRDLSWPERQRRYRLEEQTMQARQSLTEAEAELGGLGVELVDPITGEIAFPTRVNGREAAYSWRVSESEVVFWRYDNENLRRPVPDEGSSPTSLRYTSSR